VKMHTQHNTQQKTSSKTDAQYMYSQAVFMGREHSLHFLSPVNMSDKTVLCTGTRQECCADVETVAHLH